MMSIKNIIVSIFAVAMFSTFALAQGAPPNMPKDGGPKKEGMGGGPGGRGGFGKDERGMRDGGMRGPGMDFNRLNLTDAQKQKIQALQESAMKSRESNKAQFEEMGKLMQLKREGLLTAEQGTRLTALEVQMQTQMKTNMEKMQNDLLSVLTADQKVLFEQMKKEREERGKGRGEDGQKRRGPGGGQGGPGQKTPPPPTNN
jgi:Spy/CpxP family protein refolding chaperone